MISQFGSRTIEAHITTEVCLAEIASCDAVRRMHQELELFYRTQLIAALAAERLGQIVFLQDADRTAGRELFARQPEKRASILKSELT